MPQPRNKRVDSVERVAITKATRNMAEDLNAAKQRIKELEQTVTDEQVAKRQAARKKKLKVAQKKRRAARRNGTSSQPEKCQGFNLMGQPCGQPTLIPENWDGDEEIDPNFCVHHQPGGISYEKRIAFQRRGTAKNSQYRRVSPSEIAHHIMEDSGVEFLRPYLKSLGLEIDPETYEIRRIGSGLKLHGYSRGGEVIRSRYPDYEGQVRIAEKLLDRVYGKARQSMDLVSQSSSVNVHVEMDPERVTKVAEVLRNAGALTNGNGNGNGHVDVEITDAEVVEDGEE